MNQQGCRGCSSKKQSVYDWLSDIPEALRSSDMVEVQFKNTRKGYYLNSEKLEISKGDIVAVEASPGHDIGEVTLTGKLVELAMKKHRFRTDRGEIPRIYRLARPNDLERWEEAKSREEGTMIQARQIAADLNLEMKIGDVEYQGDGNKAIFYYIADGRVDFRQLIRVLADTFHIRIEMKQIGARQEAGRIGGIGPCGRELCCSSWMNNFISVNTSAARLQDLSPNPQKLTGMCGKLKCCMNYEVNTYAEAQRCLPSKEVILQTNAGEYHHFKTDYLQRLVTYSTSPHQASGLVTISARRAFEIISMNKEGERPETLESNAADGKANKHSADILSDNSLTRFDKKRKPAGKPNPKGARGASSAKSSERMNGSARPIRREASSTNPNHPTPPSGGIRERNRRQMRERTEGGAVPQTSTERAVRPRGQGRAPRASSLPRSGANSSEAEN